MKPPHSGGRPPAFTQSGRPQPGRPQRGAQPGRPQADRPQSERPHSERPKSERPQSDRPQSDRPQSDRPKFDRPKSDRPYSAKSDRPYSERPQFERGKSEHPKSEHTKSGRPQSGAPASSGRLTAPARPDAPAPEAPARPPYAGGSPRPRQAPQNQRAVAPAGTVWLYGVHPVAAALANPNRRVRRLLVTEEAEATLAGILKPPFSIAPERTDRARLDQMLGHDTVHQGVALLADPLAQPTLTQVLERPGPVLILDQVTDPRNIGAILRSAAAFGVAGVITQDRNAPDETGALAKAASGALEIIPVIRAVNLARTLVALKAANLWVVGLAANMPALRGSAFAQRRVALVLGAEGTGLRRLTRETCDELAGLAMPGSMESLNVSAAATVALYELTRGA